MDPEYNDFDVYALDCLCCNTPLTHRAMLAGLIADYSHKVFSTDTYYNISSVGNIVCGHAPTVGPSRTFAPDPHPATDGYTPRSICACWIRKIACHTCGLIVGYHVERPCFGCTKAKNNGHRWMLDQKMVTPRLLSVKWGDLSDHEGINLSIGR